MSPDALAQTHTQKHTRITVISFCHPFHLFIHTQGGTDKERPNLLHTKKACNVCNKCINGPTITLNTQNELTMAKKTNNLPAYVGVVNTGVACVLSMMFPAVRNTAIIVS